MALSVDQLTMLSIALLALGLLIAAGVLIVREMQRARTAQLVVRAIDAAGRAALQPATGKFQSNSVVEEADLFGATSDPKLPAHWLETRLGKALVADEDRRLIDQCGFHSVRAQLSFFYARIAMAVGLPVIGFVLSQAKVLPGPLLIVLAFALVLGFMIPKWVIGSIASGRREQVADELPLFVDLLRLLQGVGLSLDQSLQIMATDFAHVLKVLSKELLIANQQYASGRTREHSLQRLATLYDDEALAGLMALLVQVDRHGGAVQEPLKQFGERLRELRRSELKERIGKITVKMTAVMVLALLPALLIVTAGPGFLAIIRSLGSMAK